METEQSYMVPTVDYGDEPAGIPTPQEFRLPTPEELEKAEAELEEQEGGFSAWVDKEGLRTAGSVIGSIGASWGARTPAGILARSAMGAFGGGAAGEAAQQAREGADADRLVIESIAAGSEEAMYDLIGGSLFKSGSMMFQRMRPARREMGAELSAAHRLMQKHGGQLTARHVTDSHLMDFADATVRGAIFGAGSHEAVDLANKEAIVNAARAFRGQFSDTALSELSERGYGEQLRLIVDGGHDLFKKVSGGFYEQLDEVVKSGKAIQVSDVPTGLVDEFGQPIVRQEASEVTVGAVSMDAVKKNAKVSLDRIKKIKKSGVSKEAVSELEKLVSQESRLTFKEAHELRSSLLGMVRDLSVTKTESNLGRQLTKSVRDIESAMAKGAKDKGIWRQYENTNRFYRTNKEIFRNKLLMSMLKDEKALQNIGESLYSHGRYVELTKIRQAFDQVENLVKKHPEYLDEISDPVARESLLKFNKESATKRLQAGYLSRLFKDVNPEEGKVGFGILDNVLSDRLKMETMKELFTPKQIVHLKVLNKAVKESLGKPEGGIGGIVRWKQATSLGKVTETVGGVGLVASGGAMMAGADVGAIMVGATLIEVTPTLMGKIMTNPNLVRNLAKATTMSPKTPKAGALIAKIISDIAEIQSYGELGTREAYMERKRLTQEWRDLQTERFDKMRLPTEEELLQMQQSGTLQ